MRIRNQAPGIQKTDFVYMGTAHAAGGGPSSATLHRLVETGSIYCVVEKLLLRGYVSFTKPRS